jgi:hypothetical protein
MIFYYNFLFYLCIKIIIKMVIIAGKYKDDTKIDGSAGLIIFMLFILTIFGGVIGIYNILFDSDFELIDDNKYSLRSIFNICLIYVPNIIYFLRKDRWRTFYNQIEELPAKKRNFHTRVTIAIFSILFILVWGTFIYLNRIY